MLLPQPHFNLFTFPSQHMEPPAPVTQVNLSVSISLCPTSSPPARPTARTSNCPQVCSPFASLHQRDKVPPGITAQQPLNCCSPSLLSPQQMGSQAASGRAMLSLSSDQHPPAAPPQPEQGPRASSAPDVFALCHLSSGFSHQVFLFPPKSAKVLLS